MLLGPLFHIIEAADELLVRALKGIVRVDVIEACCIDEREEDITELIGGTLLVHVFHLGFKLLNLLLDLGPHLTAFLPVKTNVSGFVLHTICLDKRRQRIGNAT